MLINQIPKVELTELFLVALLNKLSGNLVSEFQCTLILGIIVEANKNVDRTWSTRIGSIVIKGTIDTLL